MSAWANPFSAIRRHPFRSALAVLAAFLLLLSAGVAALLYTEPGRAALADYLASALSKPGEAEIAIDHLHGSLPTGIRIDRVAVSDSDGKWLEIRDLALDWSPMQLIHGRLQVDTARAGEVTVLRRPVSSATGARSSGGQGMPPIPTVLNSLAIDVLKLEKPVLGEAARLSVSGSASLLKTRVTAHLKADRVDGRRGHASLALDWDAPTGSLNIDAGLSEPSDGLVARLLDLPGKPPLDFSVAGDGPARDWRGNASLEAGPLLSANSSLAISVDPGFGLDMKGNATPGEPLGPDIAALMGPKTAFDLELRREASTSTWTVAVNELKSAAIAASGKAKLEIAAGRIDGTLDIAAIDGARLARFTGPAKFAKGRAKLDFQGPLTHPVVRLDGSLQNLAAEGFAASAGTIHAEVRPDRPFDASDARVAIQGKVSFDGFSTPSRALSDVLGGSPSLTVKDARLDGYSKLNVGQLAVAGANGDASASGRWAIDTNVLDSKGQIAIPDLRPFSDIAKRKIGGSLETRFRLARDTDGALDLTLDGGLRNASLEQPVIESLLGPDAGFSGKAVRQPDGALAISDLKVTSKGATATGNLSLPAGAKTLQGEYDLTVTDLKALNVADPAGPAGSLAVTGTISGPLGNPALEGRISFAGGTAGGVRVKQVDARYRIADVAAAPNGTVSLTGDAGDIAGISGKTDFRLADARLVLTQLALSALDTRAQGSLTIPLDGTPIDGSVTVKSDNIAAWSRLAGRQLKGSLDGKIRLSGAQKSQDASIDAGLTGLSLGGTISSARTRLKLTATDVSTTPRLKGAVVASGLQGGPANLAEARLAFDGSLSNLQYSLNASGTVRDGELALDAGGHLSRTDNVVRLSVARLAGKLGGVPVKLRQPVRMELAPTIDSGAIDLALGDGSLRGHYRQDEKAVSLRADVVSVPLASVWPSAPAATGKAVVDASVRLDGPVARPQGSLTFDATGLAAGEIKDAKAGLSLHLQGDIKDGKIDANGQIEGLAGVKSKLQISLPATLSISPVKFALDRQAQVSGSFTFAGPVGPAWGLAGVDRHRLKGHGDVAIALSGSLGNPQISGHVKLSDGHYENLDTGTILSDMQVVARLSNSSLTIEKATAKDGGDGEVSLTGGVDFGGAALANLNLAAHFHRARVVRRDELNATVSGDLDLTGNMDRRKIAGSMEVNEAQIALAGGLPPGIVEIPVQEIGTPPPGAVRAPAPTKPSKTDLDLRISMKNRIFVRGRGLDSEWGGNLTVTGTTAAPRVQGELHPLRGRYDFAGKVFKLSKGSIVFAGSEEINPSIDLTAERDATDLTAIIHVTGTAKHPKISLESTPPYPQDEILARVLFNKSTGRLSPTEAVQLAQAVGTLTGATGGGGIMDFARKMLDLDVLSFGGGGTDGKSAAEAGKYINDRVYVGVQGDAAGDTGVTVDVEITPHLKLEGDAGSGQNSELGLKWKQDY